MSLIVAATAHPSFSITDGITRTQGSNRLPYNKDAHPTTVDSNLSPAVPNISVPHSAPMVRFLPLRAGVSFIVQRPCSVRT